MFTDVSEELWASVVKQVRKDHLSEPLEQQQHEPLPFLGETFTDA